MNKNFQRKIIKKNLENMKKKENYVWGENKKNGIVKCNNKCIGTKKKGIKII
jgi:hypothetical protein